MKSAITISSSFVGAVLPPFFLLGEERSCVENEISVGENEENVREWSV